VAPTSGRRSASPVLASDRDVEQAVANVRHFDADVIEALTGIRSQSGDVVAFYHAASNVSASMRFLLEAMGPRAARVILSAAITTLEDAIRAENADTGCLR
jgi:hypothetical protein